MRFGRTLFAFVMACRSLCFADELVTDEALRQRVLQLAFPDAHILTTPSRPPGPWSAVTDPGSRVIARVRDVLEGGRDYEVAAPVGKEEEGAASDIVRDAVASDTRHLQMRLYRWSSTEPFLVAIMRYSFMGAKPARCCLSIGRILLLSNAADRVLDVFDKTPHAFTMFTGLEFLPRRGAVPERLMLSYDAAGAGNTGVISVIFDASEKRLRLVISVDTLELYEADPEGADVHTLTLDRSRTLFSEESQFFFTRKSYMDRGKFLRRPETTVVSFPPGYGLPLDWN